MPWWKKLLWIICSWRFYTLKVKLGRRQAPRARITNTSLSGILHDIFANRGIKDQAELELRLSNLLPISSLGNVKAAADLILNAINADKRILVVADFDADGATACALVVRALRQLNANITYRVPNRSRHGYGLSAELVQETLKLEVDLIITVDNGIASFAGIALARENNIKVIVTDHHLPAANLPAANVIINPNLVSETFASKNLCGVGVAFYLVCALHDKLTQDNWYKEHNIKPLIPASYLDLAAFGTVADVVTLDKNNRILIKAGIGKIRSGSSCAGIKALLEIVSLKEQYVAASDIAFKLAPRINAAGRMEDMSIGIECLLSDDKTNAMKLAATLDSINQERQDIERTMQEQAKQVVDGFQADNDLPFGLCLYQKTWHEGIVGIVAGRLKEKLHRPVIAFAKNGNSLKGSARSVHKINIRDALDSIDKNYPGLIDKFGGHAMAAGLNIKPHNFTAFAEAFDQTIRGQLTIDDMTGEILSDGQLGENEFNLAFAKLLRDISPWGQDFPEPIFDGEFAVLEQRVVGDKHLKMTLKSQQSSIPLEAIAFNQPPLNLTENLVRIAYRLNLNYWQDNVSLQLVVLYIGL